MPTYNVTISSLCNGLKELFFAFKAVAGEYLAISLVSELLIIALCVNHRVFSWIKWIKQVRTNK